MRVKIDGFSIVDIAFTLRDVLTLKLCMYVHVVEYDHWQQSLSCCCDKTSGIRLIKYSAVSVAVCGMGTHCYANEVIIECKIWHSYDE